MPDEELKAKVFISCGQRRKSEEVQIANEISERLARLDYDPYLAVQQQSLRGVRQNIFQELETSEYFLSIDFKREPVVPCYRSGRYPIISFSRYRLQARASCTMLQVWPVSHHLVFEASSAARFSLLTSRTCHRILLGVASYCLSGEGH